MSIQCIVSFPEQKIEGFPEPFFCHQGNSQNPVRTYFYCTASMLPHLPDDCNYMLWQREYRNNKMVMLVKNSSHEEFKEILK